MIQHNSSSTKKSWIMLSLVTVKNQAVPNEPFRLTLSDGDVVSGRLDARGRVRVEGIPPGECKVVFPEHDVKRAGGG